MGQEQPSGVAAFPNAPGMITLKWDHSGAGVFWFVVEQEAPYTFWVADAGKRIWSVLGLEPNHTYRYRVCAVYDFNRVCSDESHVGWVAVTTFPPEQQQEPPPPIPPPDECGPQLPRYLSSFESLNFPGHLMRHRNFLGELTPVASALDRADATFIVRPGGLTGTTDAVSFESINFPNHFLRHNFSRIKLHANDGSDLFRKDATFRLQPHGSRGTFSQVRYEAVNFPGHFIRHSNFELSIARDDGSDLFAKDSTWRRLHAPIGNTPPGSVSFESVNFPCHFMRHRNALGELTRVSSDLDRADATFAVRPALNGSPIGVSLESLNFPGQYLRHSSFRIKLQANDGSDLFHQDATFIYNDGAVWEGNGGVSFESANFPGHFIRHSNFELWLAQTDGSTQFAKDASWQPVPARKT